MKHVKILLLEETAPTRRLLRGMLRDLGYGHVEEARDVAVAEKLLKGHTFDVILVDWRKPGLAGIGFVDRLRLDTSPAVAMTPVIVLSGAVDLPMLQKAAELGVRSVLAKPFSLRVLAAHLDAATARETVTPLRRRPTGAPAPIQAQEPVQAPMPMPLPAPLPVQMPTAMPLSALAAQGQVPDDPDVFYV